MIEANYDRTNIFGASDTKYFEMGWKTKGFNQWWMVKTGQVEDDFVDNKYITAGNMLEEPVIDCIMENEGIVLEKDIPPLLHPDHERLIVNLDARLRKDGKPVPYEIKCCNYQSVMITGVKAEKKYIKQLQSQMYTDKAEEGMLVYYAVQDHEYEMSYLVAPEVDYNRIVQKPQTIDWKYINGIYVPILEYFTDCINFERQPDDDVRKEILNEFKSNGKVR